MCVHTHTQKKKEAWTQEQNGGYPLQEEPEALFTLCSVVQSERVTHQTIINTNHQLASMVVCMDAV